jgi:diacylglycerol O-acyltransferase
VRRSPRLERLSPLDVSNLRVEKHGLPMNVAAIALLERVPLVDASGELAVEAIRTRVARRLDRAPRLQQKLHAPGFGFGPPVWVDDEAFNVGRHVRARTVPAPGDEQALLAACAELNERPFDRSRPLWEIWFLTGLRDGTVGMLIRFHHVLADGMAALVLLGSLFDAEPGAAEPEVAPWIPQPSPGRRDLLADNLARYGSSLRVGVGRIRHPGPTGRRLGVVVRQITRVIREGRAPGVSFNRPVGRHQRLVLVRADLARARSVAHAHHATVNDVVLAAMAGGARVLLEARGELRPDLVLKVSVAASVRAQATDVTAGNLVGIIVAPIPVGEADPIRRLERIARTTAERKRLPPYQPAARFMQRWMVRVMNKQRVVNLLASNLPGPPRPMYFAGAQVLEVFQVGVVQGNLTLSVGVLSYAGQLNFDIVGDTDAVPDLAVFARGIADDLAGLGVTTGAAA